MVMRRDDFPCVADFLREPSAPSGPYEPFSTGVSVFYGRRVLRRRARGYYRERMPLGPAVGEGADLISLEFLRSPLRTLISRGLVGSAIRMRRAGTLVRGDGHTVSNVFARTAWPVGHPVGWLCLALPGL